MTTKTTSGNEDLSLDIQNAEDISEEILVIDWTLAAQDLEFISCHRGSENILRLSIQLCTLRKTGRESGSPSPSS